MEEKGLIERKPNPEDGRGVLIYLTPFGLEKRKDSKDVVLRFNEMVKDQLSTAQLNSFFEVMDTINQVISEKKIFNKESATN
jgi:DNA-binding MarR family transcriptional regulator